LGGWVGKRYWSAKLAAARQSIQWQNEYPDRSTDHKARNNPLWSIWRHRLPSADVACIIQPALTLLKWKVEKLKIYLTINLSLQSVKTDLHTAHRRQDKSRLFYISDHDLVATFTTKWISSLLSKFLRI
jgi:hypothetical protein